MFNAATEKKGHIYFRATGHSFFLNLCQLKSGISEGNAVLIGFNNVAGSDKKSVFVASGFWAESHNAVSDLVLSGASGIDFALSQTINWHTRSQGFSDYHISYDLSGEKKVISVAYCGASRLYSREVLLFSSSDATMPDAISSMSATYN